MRCWGLGILELRGLGLEGFRGWGEKVLGVSS